MAEPDRIADTLALDEPVGRVRMVSAARAKALADLGVHTVRDLLLHMPRRYIDLSAVQTVAASPIGQLCTVVGTVHKLQLKRPRPRLSLVEITLVDSTGALVVTAFNQPWLMDSVQQGAHIAAAGKVEFSYGFKRMTNPFLEVLGDGAEGEGKVVAVHPASEKLSAAMIRRLIANALELTDGLLDPLPLDLRLRYRLMSRATALRCLHEPRSMEEAAQARRRLAYEEVLLLQLALMTQSAQRGQGRNPVCHVTDGPALRALGKALPFKLTSEQARAKSEILARMAAPALMNHMLLGDVGTGKTAVAAFALAAAADTGGQALLMAPTEVLARQHGHTLGPLLDAVGITWDVLTGSTSAKDRARIKEALAAGELQVLIGTHALIEDDIEPANLTLAVIDEQQRFGVAQRAKLLGKGQAPDALYLTATPIPRTLALAVYGNLSLSYIKERPNKGASRTTRVHRKAEQGRAYDAARAALARGEQVYVVCPLIDDAPKKNERSKRAPWEDEERTYPSVAIESEEDLQGLDTAAAAREAEWLQRTVFPDAKVGLLHGRMKPAEKQRVMEAFSRGETQVLVATTVIEVGVDVPNATVMVIQDADHFGLSQLHQLRGRVGRGAKDAEVHLISQSKDPSALSRLEALEKMDDGFELASYDLSLRREGDILGNRQHGASGLRLVNVARDSGLIEAAHADAVALMRDDPSLQSPSHKALAREMRALYPVSPDVKGG